MKKIYLYEMEDGLHLGNEEGTIYTSWIYKNWKTPKNIAKSIFEELYDFMHYDDYELVLEKTTQKELNDRFSSKGVE